MRDAITLHTALFSMVLGLMGCPGSGYGMEMQASQWTAHVSLCPATSLTHHPPAWAVKASQRCLASLVTQSSSDFLPRPKLRRVDTARRVQGPHLQTHRYVTKNAQLYCLLLSSILFSVFCPGHEPLKTLLSQSSACLLGSPPGFQ